MKSHCGAFERIFSFETPSVQRPLGCFLSGGFFHFQPNGSNMDTGIEEERASACESEAWQFGLYKDASTIMLPHSLSDAEQGI